MHKNTYSLCVSATLAVALLTPLAMAQIIIPPGSDAGALQQRRIDEEQRRLEIERLKRNPVTDPLRRDAPPAPAPIAPASVTFRVNEIRFTPSDIFTESDLRIMVQGYENRVSTFADLQRVVDHVNAEYRRRGVATAQATLPPQDITTGVILIRLIEGRVGEIRIQGNASTRERYITSRIRLGADKLVDLPAFEEDLKLFNRTNDIQLRAELKPGSKTGATDVVLDVIEPPRHAVRLILDNLGSKSTGRDRAGIAYSNRSLLGYRDEASLSATRADGLKSYSVSYGVPVNRLGGRVSLAYYKDYTDIKHGPQAPLEITGESTAAILTYRQPFYYGNNVQADYVAAAKRRKSKTWSSDVLLQDTTLSDFNAGLEYQRSDASGAWFATYNASIGTASARTTGLRRDYFAGRGSLRRTQIIGEGWSALGVFSFQHTSDDLLPASEQFIIGGHGSVRGFPIGTYAGDNGMTVNAELHHPLGSKGAVAHPLHLATTGMFFVDFGRVSPYRPPGSVFPNHNAISSAGWGVNYTLGKRVYGRVIYGYAISGLTPDTSRSTVYFQLVAQLF